MIAQLKFEDKLVRGSLRSNRRFLVLITAQQWKPFIKNLIDDQARALCIKLRSGMKFLVGSKQKKQITWINTKNQSKSRDSQKATENRSQSRVLRSTFSCLRNKILFIGQSSAYFVFFFAAVARRLRQSSKLVSLKFVGHLFGLVFAYIQSRIYKKINPKIIYRVY